MTMKQIKVIINCLNNFLKFSTNLKNVKFVVEIDKEYVLFYLHRSRMDNKILYTCFRILLSI